MTETHVKLVSEKIPGKKIRKNILWRQTWNFYFFILGMAVGVAAIYIWLTAKSDGTLRIDSSDPDGPYMFLEVRRSIEDIRKKPFVILRVNLKSYLTRK